MARKQAEARRKAERERSFIDAGNNKLSGLEGAAAILQRLVRST
jgi:hypothetical protein